MNEISLVCTLEMIRNICDNRNHNIEIKYRLDNRYLELYNIYINEFGKKICKEINVGDEKYEYFVRIENFSMCNMKKLISVMKNERLKINKIEIIY